MLRDPLDLVAEEVLKGYPLPRQFSCQPLGSAGGFSGARLWRIRSFSEDFCLKAWPSRGTTPQQLTLVHRLMETARLSDLRFVPTVIHDTKGATWQTAGDRLWDLTEWMPGQADFSACPSTRRLEAACVALAQLHEVWRRADRTVAVPPSVMRRMHAAGEWAALLHEKWRPDFGSALTDPFADVARQAWKFLPVLLPTIGPALAPWTGKADLLQPCVCDVWHDHVLFDEDRVTGIIDYGAMRLDHPATDLARLLGSMAGDDEALYSAGLAAYRQLLPLSEEDERLVRVLDRTGTILAAGNWLLWLYRDGRPFSDHAAAARRLQAITLRLATWVRQAAIVPEVSIGDGPAIQWG